jgi:hypothetical protein
MIANNRTRSPGYLETDRPENVGFYRKFGFDVTGTASIEGVLTYFMRSPKRYAVFPRTSKRRR